MLCFAKSYQEVTTGGTSGEGTKASPASGHWSQQAVWERQGDGKET